jgi:hypothetical protein
MLGLLCNSTHLAVLLHAAVESWVEGQPLARRPGQEIC